jgi:hypothetical protein
MKYFEIQIFNVKNDAWTDLYEIDGIPANFCDQQTAHAELDAYLTDHPEENKNHFNIVEATL